MCLPGRHVAVVHGVLHVLPEGEFTGNLGIAGETLEVHVTFGLGTAVALVAAIFEDGFGFFPVRRAKRWQRTGGKGGEEEEGWIGG